MAAKKEEDVKDAEMADAGAEASKEPEKPKEQEVDAPADKRAKVAAGSTKFNTTDTTMNVMPTAGGELLMALSEGGFQYLLAGAKASVGLKRGRYMFEAVIAEMRNPAEPQGTAQPPRPKHIVKLGFVAEDVSSLIAGEELAVSFDSEGYFAQGKNRKKISQKFGQGEVVAILLNLDANSANANTISIFRDGERICEPQPLPDSFKGKTLFPVVNFRNVSLRVNFGPEALKDLPFTCRMVDDAAKEDVVVKAEDKPKDGKYEVLFPVSLPDEGSFDWLDSFLEKNRNYTEVSDRAILDWAKKSGIQRPAGYNQRSSFDKPEMGFGLPLLDDLSVSKIIKGIAPLMARNLIIMEVKANLVPAERQAILAPFAGTNFKRIAYVTMGSPAKEFVDWVNAAQLKDKLVKAEADVKKKNVEAKRKRAEDLRKKKALEAKKAREDKAKKEAEDRKKAAEAKKAEVKKALEAKKKAAEDKKAAEAKKESDAEEPKEEDEPKEEESKEEPAEEAKEEPKEEVEELEELVEEVLDPATVKLTDEEKGVHFRKKATPDVGEKDLSEVFTKFALPKKDEGFDEVKFAWDKEAKCSERLTAFLKEKKLTQRVDSLEPGAWFKKEQASWMKLLSEWKKKHQDFHDPALKRKKKEEEDKKAAVKKRAKEEKRKIAAAKKEAEKQKKAAERKELAEKGVEVDENEAEEAEDEPEEEDDEPEEPKPKEIDIDELEVFAVENIMDVGSGEPIFSKFSYADWALLSIRFELHLLAHAFCTDLNDPERPAFHESHIGFYYNKYFNKQFSLKQYGCEQLADLVTVVEDTVEINSVHGGTVESVLAKDTPLENFIRLAEDSRRERQQRIDAGDKTAELKITKPVAAPPSAPPQLAAGAARPAGLVQAPRPGGAPLRPGMVVGAAARYGGPGGGAAAAGAPRPAYGQGYAASTAATASAYGAAAGLKRPMPSATSTYGQPANKLVRTAYGAPAPAGYNPYGAAPPAGYGAYGAPSAYGAAPSGYGTAPSAYGAVPSAYGAPAGMPGRGPYGNPYGGGAGY